MLLGLLKWFFNVRRMVFRKSTRRISKHLIFIDQASRTLVLMKIILQWWMRSNFQKKTRKLIEVIKVYFQKLERSEKLSFRMNFQLNAETTKEIFLHGVVAPNSTKSQKFSLP